MSISCHYFPIKGTPLGKIETLLVLRLTWLVLYWLCYIVIVVIIIIIIIMLFMLIYSTDLNLPINLYTKELHFVIIVAANRDIL